MNAADKTTEQPQPTRRPCLVDGCPCKDARIVSRRRAAYFAARARQTGQTADRIMAVEAEWSSFDEASPTVLNPGAATIAILEPRASSSERVVSSGVGRRG